MLSSIHPLGERGRHNRWMVTVGAFTIASTITGAAVGGALGLLGSAALGVDPGLLLVGTAVIAVAAGVLDLARVRPPGSERQVNESWIGHYRGWVYGGAFGVQLGTGVMTYVVTWGVYATFAAEILTASPIGGALVGAVFGFGRSIALLAAGRIDRPSRLTSFHQLMADLGGTIRRGSAVGTAAAGAVAGIVFLI